MKYIEANLTKGEIDKACPNMCGYKIKNKDGAIKVTSNKGHK